jgi:hypothetical protein
MFNLDNNLTIYGLNVTICLKGVCVVKVLGVGQPNAVNFKGMPLKLPCSDAKNGTDS